MNRDDPRTTDFGEALRRAITSALATSPTADLGALLEPPDAWVVSLPIAHLLTRLVDHRRPRSILEFGAGRSSLVLASALHAAGGGRLTSLEHQPAYAENAWRRVQALDAVDAEKLIGAPLDSGSRSKACSGSTVGVRSALARRGPFDFVFIDAPPGHMGRDSTLFTAAPYLRVERHRRPRRCRTAAGEDRCQPMGARHGRAAGVEADSVGRGVASCAWKKRRERPRISEPSLAHFTIASCNGATVLKLTDAPSNILTEGSERTGPRGAKPFAGKPPSGSRRNVARRAGARSRPVDGATRGRMPA